MPSVASQLAVRMAASKSFRTCPYLSKAARNSSTRRLYSSAVSTRPFFGGGMSFSAAMCEGRPRSRHARGVQPAIASLRPSHRRCRPAAVRIAAGRPIARKLPRPWERRAAACHIGLPAGQTSSRLAGTFQTSVRGGERSAITARSPSGERFLSRSSSGPLARVASPPRATSFRNVSSLPVTIVWASTASDGCGQDAPAAAGGR